MLTQGRICSCDTNGLGARASGPVVFDRFKRASRKVQLVRRIRVCSFCKAQRQLVFKVRDLGFSPLPRRTHREGGPGGAREGWEPSAWTEGSVWVD